MKVRITEYLEIDSESEKWFCERCGHALIGARENYKKGCLVAEIPLEEVHPPMLEGQAYSFCPDPAYTRLLEFYCPGCGVMIENEYLPPGHPITHDIQLDIDALKKRSRKKEGISEEKPEAIIIHDTQLAVEPLKERPVAKKGISEEKLEVVVTKAVVEIVKIIKEAIGALKA